MHDIPLVIDAVPDKKISVGATQITYVTARSMPELFEFYVQELSRLGWDVVTKYLPDEGEAVLCYQKPSKWSIVIIRPARGRMRAQQVTIYCFQK